MSKRYNNRRKKLANALSLAGWERGAIARACAEAGVDAELRAEALSFDDYVRLAATLGPGP